MNKSRCLHESKLICVLEEKKENIEIYESEFI